MTTVGLVQINQSFSGQGYFPYSVGLLEAHARAHVSRPADYRFLTPLFQRLPIDEAVEQLADADVLALSLYVWNFNYSMELARRFKERRPDALVVAGGPHVPDSVEVLHKHNHERGAAADPGRGRMRDRTEQFLVDYACIDVAVHAEGERVFTAILEDLARWREAPSISFLHDGRVQRNPRIERLKTLDEIPSPYLSGTFDALIAANPDHQWIAMWETNRGCPFSCTFCDWGSAVASKLNKWEQDRLRAEIDWFAMQKIEFVFCADANFGILPRDIELAKYFAETKRRTGYPVALSVQSTKNAENRSFEVQKILSDAGLNKGVVVSMQSLDPQTLHDIKRANISLESFKNLQRRFTEAGVETMSDLILGLPGETYESFVDGVSKLVELGQHNRIQFQNLSILPNAEMGDPAYQERYGMELVTSRIINIHGEREDSEISETQCLVVGTNTMSRDQWVRTRAFSWMTAFLHFDKLFQIPLVLAHEVAGVPYRDLLMLFGDRQFDPARYPTLAAVHTFFVDKARDIQSGGEEYCYSPDWLGIWWPADEFQLIDCVAHDRLDVFYEEAAHCLGEFLATGQRTLPPGLLSDAVALNHALVKLPFQSSDVEILVSYNIWDVYLAALRNESVPLEHAPRHHRIDRTSRQWPSWNDWCREVVWWGNKKGAYLYGNQVVGPELAGHY